MKKNTPHRLLSTLSWFFLFLVIPCFASAALVQIDLHADFPVQPSKQTKTQLNVSSEQPQQKENYHPNDYRTDNSPLFHIPQNTEEVQQKSKLYDLKTQGKKLLNDYQDNELLFESLNTLSQAKQLWSNADSLATDFTHDIIFSLELDVLIQSEISTTPALQNLNSGFSTQQAQETPTHIYQASTVNYNLYDTKQGGLDNISTPEADTITFFLSGLLHITTLYYLAALLILVSFLQWLIPFLLRLFP